MVDLFGIMEVVERVATGELKTRVPSPPRHGGLASRMGLLPRAEMATGKPETMVEAYHLSAEEAFRPLPIRQVVGDRAKFWITSVGERFLRELRVGPDVYDGVVLIYKPVDGNQRYGLVLRPSHEHRDREKNSPAVYIKELSRQEYEALGMDTKIRLLNASNFAVEAKVAQTVMVG